MDSIDIALKGQFGFRVASNRGDPLLAEDS